MEDHDADAIVDRHWQSVVNSIKAGAADEDLTAVLEAERRRDPPRDAVLSVLERRRAAIDGVIEADDDSDDADDSDGTRPDSER